MTLMKKVINRAVILIVPLLCTTACSKKISDTQALLKGAWASWESNGGSFIAFDGKGVVTDYYVFQMGPGDEPGKFNTMQIRPAGEDNISYKLEFQDDILTLRVYGGNSARSEWQVDSISKDAMETKRFKTRNPGLIRDVVSESFKRISQNPLDLDKSPSEELIKQMILWAQKDDAGQPPTRSEPK